MVNVTGQIADPHIIIDPSAIDIGLCYLTGSEQTVSFHLRNTSRVVVPYEIRLPQELSKHAELRHSKGYLKAGSSVEVFIRLRLKCLYYNNIIIFNITVLKPPRNGTYKTEINNSPVPSSLLGF